MQFCYARSRAPASGSAGWENLVAVGGGQETRRRRRRRRGNVVYQLGQRGLSLGGFKKTRPTPSILGHSSSPGAAPKVAELARLPSPYRGVGSGCVCMCGARLEEVPEACKHLESRQSLLLMATRSTPLNLLPTPLAGGVVGATWCRASLLKHRLDPRPDGAAQAPAANKPGRMILA